MLSSLAWLLQCCLSLRVTLSSPRRLPQLQSAHCPQRCVSGCRVTTRVQHTASISPGYVSATPPRFIVPICDAVRCANRGPKLRARLHGLTGWLAPAVLRQSCPRLLRGGSSAPLSRSSGHSSRLAERPCSPHRSPVAELTPIDRLCVRCSNRPQIPACLSAVPAVTTSVLHQPISHCCCSAQSSAASPPSYVLGPQPSSSTFSSMQPFNESRFRAQVTKSLSAIRTILDNNRNPTFPADVQVRATTSSSGISAPGDITRAEGEGMNQAAPGASLTPDCSLLPLVPSALCVCASLPPASPVPPPPLPVPILSAHVL